MIARIATNPMPDPAAPAHGNGDADATDRPHVYYIDGASLDRRTSRDDAHGVDQPPARAVQHLRWVATVDDQVSDLRANVRDAARAVLTWLSAVVAHEGQTDLDDVLDRCLRPGPDPARINYTEMARQISGMLCIDLSPKRVRTAIEHLRRARLQQDTPQPRRQMAPRFDALDELLSGMDDLDGDSGHQLIVDTLAAVRSAAGRLIESDFAEGVPAHVDLDELRQRFLDFVHDTLAVDEQPITDAADRLRRALANHDGSAMCDMRLVTAGSRVVIALADADSLPCVLAQLNVVVVGREMLGTDLYRSELFRLADRAAQLHDDPATRRFMRRVRRLPAEQRLPSPLRVRSYCLNNAATHILQRLFTGELVDADGKLLAKAEWCIDQMSRRDGAFQLLDPTRAIHAATVAMLTDDDAPVIELFQGWGRDRSQTVLRDLVAYDNCPSLVEAVRSHAVAAIPDLRFALICVR